MAVKALLKLDKAELDDDGKIIGLSEQIKSLQESDSYLFNVETPTEMKGMTPASATDEAGTHIDLSKMSYDELDTFFKENPNYSV